MRGRRVPLLHRRARATLVICLVALFLMPALPGFAASMGRPLRTSVGPLGAPSGAHWRTTASPAPLLTGLWNDLTSKLKTPPTARAAQSMADDPLLHAVVLFGGNDPSSGSAFGDTWEFVNGSWSDLTANLTTAPSARWGAGLAYDPAYQGLILFGGRNPGSTNWIFNDTWLFNATGWHKLNVTKGVAPSPRTPYGSLVYDSADGYLLLFGGNYGTNYRLNDTWSFKNGTWTDLTSTLKSSPPAAGFSAANDTADGYDLFYGGATWSGGNYAETWSFSGGAWTNRTTSSGTAPPMTSGSDAMSYDPVDQGVVVYSGEDNSYTVVNDTYLYAGGTWTNVSGSVGTPPTARWTGSMAYDATLGGDLLMGGNEAGTYNSSIFAANDTWEFAHPFRVAATASLTTGSVPLTVNFTSIAGPATGTVAYNWSFGDGSANATTQNASHTFTSIGTYTVKLSAKDTAGHTGNTSVGVRSYAALAVTATVGPAAIDLPLAIAFNSSISGGLSPYSRTWSFGDGTSSHAANTTHVYNLPSTYAWSLVAFDAAGHRRAQYGNVTVYPTLVVSTTETGQNGVVPLNVTFTASVSAGDPPYALSWAFGDGATAGNRTSVSHTYTTPGLFNATLTVGDAGRGQTAVLLPVHAVGPLALTTSVSPLAGPGPLSVQYQVTPTGGEAPYSVNWSFGSSLGTSTSFTGSFTFSAAGTYPVSLSVVDAYGDRASRAFTVVVTAPLVAVLTASATRGLAPLNVTFTAVTTGGEFPLTYVWVFGDGSGVTGGATVTHLYPSPGPFVAQAVVTSFDGQRVKSTIAVTVASAPRLTVTSNLSSVALGGAVTISAQVTGGFPAWSFSWTNLPTGCSAANAATLPCVPTAAGRFDIHVTATDTLGNARTAETNVTVVAPPSVAPASSGLPVLDLALIGLAVVVVGVGLAVGLARRRPPPPPTESPAGIDPEPAPDEPTPEHRALP